MDLITVDQERCKRDGICANVCPLKIIRIRNNDAYPALVRGAEKLCIRCGHCLAACPHDALTLRIANNVRSAYGSVLGFGGPSAMRA